MRQIFAPLCARLMETLFRDKGTRTYGLIRAANAGMQGLPFCIYNDCYDFSQYMTGLASSGFSGTLWCPEMRSARTAEEWVRRFQMGILSPMMQLNGWSSGAKPWLFPEALDHIRSALRMRYELIPYLYTAFAAYRFEGIPPFRPLCMDYSGFEGRTKAGTLDDTENPYEDASLAELIDQYLAGPDLMAAPAFPGSSSRQVVFPPGPWYDYYSGQRIEGGRTLEIDCPLERLPVFVRGGAEGGGLVPTLVGGRLVVRCYGDRGAGAFYDDDGESYAHERGAYYRGELSFVREGKALRGALTPRHEGYKTPHAPEFRLIGG
jgi:alpha-D-xyloside xylohydrolase